MKKEHGEIALYTSKDGFVQLDVQLEEETIWLTLNQMTSLFERDKSVISRHLRNIYKEGELDRKATVAKNATTASDGELSLEETHKKSLLVQDEGGRKVKRLNNREILGSCNNQYNKLYKLKIENWELVADCDRFNTLKHSSTDPYAFTEQISEIQNN